MFIPWCLVPWSIWICSLFKWGGYHCNAQAPAYTAISLFV
jgi:hypothetical protein